MRYAASRWLCAGIVLAAVSLVAGCGSAPSEPLSVGADDSAESQVLGAIYAQALDRSGFPARVRSGLGDRNRTLAALDAGTISLMPEHNGALLAHFDSRAPAETLTLEQLTAQVSGVLPQGLAISDAADGTDLRPQLLLPSTRAHTLNVSTMTDLAPHCPVLKAGYAAIPGLLNLPPNAQKIAGCEFASIENFNSPTDLLTALETGRIQLAVLGGPIEFLSDSEKKDLTIVTDPKHAIRSENPIPLFHSGTFSKPQLQQLSKIAGELTTPDLTTMTTRAAQGSPGDLARNWLDMHNL